MKRHIAKSSVPCFVTLGFIVLTHEMQNAERKIKNRNIFAQ